ncbi:hypothetical protein BDR26DRAFT_78726 [Obelidium mucronatum]|nr:hypothetical protein BDR26DRAFT_78726 [Obelidium mucronatum]
MGFLILSVVGLLWSWCFQPWGLHTMSYLPATENTPICIFLILFNSLCIESGVKLMYFVPVVGLLRCKPIPAASAKCSTTCTSTRLGKAAISASQRHMWCFGPLQTTNV